MITKNKSIRGTFSRLFRIIYKVYQSMNIREICKHIKYKKYNYIKTLKNFNNKDIREFSSKIKNKKHIILNQ